MSHPGSTSSLSAISSLELPSPEPTQISVVDHSSSPLLWRSRRDATPASQARAGRQPSPSSDQQPSLQLTPWLEMIMEQPTPASGSVLAVVFGCLLLTTFIVLPNATRKEWALMSSRTAGQVAEQLVHTTPLLWLAATCYGMGMSGLYWLWYRNRSNHAWLVDHIFLPVTMNSILGLGTTLINIYKAQEGLWFLTSIVNAALTTCIAINTLLLYIWHAALVRKVFGEHSRITVE